MSHSLMNMFMLVSLALKKLFFQFSYCIEIYERSYDMISGASTCEQINVSKSHCITLHCTMPCSALHYAVAQKRVPKCPEDHLVTIVKTWTNDGTRVLSVIKAEFPKSNQSCIASLAFEFRNTCTSQPLCPIQLSLCTVQPQLPLWAQR